MSKNTIVTILVSLFVFATIQQYMIIKYERINDRLQTAIDQCCFGKGGP